MTTSNRRPENVLDLASARLKRQASSHPLEAQALACADLMCRRLTKMYGGQATVQSLRPRDSLFYEVMLSVEWGEPAEFRHLTMVLQFSPTGEYVGAKMVPPGRGVVT